MYILRILVGLLVAHTVASQLPSEKEKERAETVVKADALIAEGRFADAVELALACIKLTKEIDGEKNWRTFDAENRLKFVHIAMGLPADKQHMLLASLEAEELAKDAEYSKPEDALKLAQKALAGFRDTVGEETVETARIWHLIGRNRVDAKESKEQNKKAVAIRRKVLPEDHPDLGRSLNNLGLAQSSLGEKRESLTSFREAIRIWKRSLGESDPLVAMGLTNLGGAQESLREYEAAKKSYMEALAIRRNVLPKDNLRIADCLYNLGAVCIFLAEYKAAQSNLDEALIIRSETLPKDHPIIAATLELLAEAQVGSGEHQAAKRSYQSALTIRRKDPIRDDEGITFLISGLGLTQIDLHEYEDARVSCEEVLAIRRNAKAPNQDLIASSLEELGRVEYMLKDYRNARTRYAEAAAIRRKHYPTSHWKLAKSLSKLARTELRLEEYVSSRKLAEESLVLFRKASNPDNTFYMLEVMWTLGKSQRELGDLATAARTLEEALVFSQKGTSQEGIEAILSQIYLADVQARLGQYTEARKGYKESLEMLKSIGDPESNLSLHGAALNDIGVTQLYLQHYGAAKESFDESLKLKARVRPRDDSDEAETLMNIGLAELGLRQFHLARDHCEAALSIIRNATPARQGITAAALMNQGHIQYELGDYEQARKSLVEALSFAKKASKVNEHMVGIVLTNLGGLAFEERDFPTARKLNEEAVEVLRKSLPANHPVLGDALRFLSQTQLMLGESQAARKSLEEATAIYSKSLPANDPRFGDVQIGQGLATLVSVQTIADISAAKLHFDKSLTLRKRLLPTGHPSTSQSLFMSGLCYHLEGDSANALLRLAEAVDNFQSDQTHRAIAQSEQEQFITTATNPSLDLLLTSASTSKDDLNPVYDRVVRSKGFVTQTQWLVRKLRERTDPETERLLTRLREVVRDLATASVGQSGSMVPLTSDSVPLMAELSAQQMKLERQLSTRNSGLNLLLAREKIGLTEVQASLYPGTCLIDFREYRHLVGSLLKSKSGMEMRLVAFVVQPGKRKVVQVSFGPSEPIWTAVDRWRNSYGMGKLPSSSDPDPATVLRNLLWDKLQKHLDESVKTLLISPDGPLTKLPFAALPGIKPNTHLIQDYSFITVPVPILLAEVFAKKPVAQGSGFLAVGAIDFGDAAKPRGFRSLPNTGVEVDALRDRFVNSFPKSAAQVLKSDKATKNEFVNKAQDAAFLHLATHGFFADDLLPPRIDSSNLTVIELLEFDRKAIGRDPDLLSAVAFAGVNSSDPAKRTAGLLTAKEVGNINLSKAELVVLSACDTGLGKVAGGEGVLGLQRAFQMAGVRTVVASLWSVDDSATRVLMTEFYRNLWEKKMPKAEAMRQAQLEMIRNFRYDAANREVVDLRGGGKRIDDLEARRKLEEQLVRLKKNDEPLSPFFWAAFVMSGDWR